MADKHFGLSVSAGAEKAPLSAGQKRFNSLLVKIEAQGKILESWNKAVPECQTLWAKEFHPSLAELRQHDRKLLGFLDDASDRIKFSKKDRETLQDIICQLAETLMGEEDHAEITRIFKKHSNLDLEANQQQEYDLLRASVEDAFGIDLGDDVDFTSVDAVHERLQQKIDEAADNAANAAKHEDKEKSARDIREEAEQQKGSQSLREVSRKLVSALHPDRETDATERDRKTIMMQRVNQAYADNDLLSLLHLQIEIEQIDQSHIDSIPADRLKHYNRLLADQLLQLQDEIEDTKMSFRHQFLLEPFAPIQPKNALKSCRKTIQELRQTIEQKKAGFIAISDPRVLKSWLKQEREATEYDRWVEEQLADEFYR